MGSSPDGLVKYKCCGESLLEIKHSYTFQNETPEEVSQDPHYHSYLDENSEVNLKCPLGMLKFKDKWECVKCHGVILSFTRKGLTYDRMYLILNFTQKSLQNVFSFLKGMLFRKL